MLNLEETKDEELRMGGNSSARDESSNLPVYTESTKKGVSFRVKKAG